MNNIHSKYIEKNYIRFSKYTYHNFIYIRLSFSHKLLIKNTEHTILASASYQIFIN